LCLRQFLQSGPVGASEAGGQAIEVGDGVGFVAEGSVGGGEFEFFRNVGFLAGHFGVIEVHFVGGEAVEAPAGGGEQGDEVYFARGPGAELGEVSVAEGAEFFFGFAGEDDLAGREAMGEGRGLAARESLRGLGSSRARSVGARGIDASLRGHKGGLLRRE
jgi:hypothetical protein